MTNSQAPNTFDESGREPRPFRLFLVLGAPGAGKTSLVDEMVARYRAAHRSNPVYMLDPNAQWPGIGHWPPDGDAAAWLAALKADRAKRGNPPGMLVLDDADKYLTGAPPTGIFRDLFTSFRHWRLDVILNARRSQDIPKVAIASAAGLALFIHRELYGRRYLAANLGTEIVDELPKERFRYLLVDVDAGESEVRATKKRATVSAADAKR
jgi:hypothetical protein